MKHKIGILMVTITLLLIAFTMSVKAECAANGDLNGDKLVNKYDVDVVVNMAKGLEPVDLCADFNGDGYIGPADISILTAKGKFEQNESFIPTLEESGVKGDVNNDKNIDYKDNNIILEMAKGKVKTTKSADVDGDGYIGAADISLITAYIKFGTDYGLIGQTYNIEEPFVYTLPHNPNCEKMTADLNNDYVIDELDEEPMIKMAKGLETVTLCADLDLDGFIGPADISILRKTVKIDIPRYNITFEPNPELFNGECSPVIGDVNKDGKTNYQDIGLTVKMAKGTLHMSTCADLDKDGFIGPADISIMTAIAKGLPVHCSITNNCTIPANDTNQTENNSTNSTGNETEPDPCDSYALPSNSVCIGLTGDLNKDGVIDELDIEVIQKMIAGQETPDICGDLDNDGIVAPGDYAKLMLTVLGDIPRCNITFDISEITAQANATQCGLPGDVNHDGSINYQDVGIIRKIVAAQYPSTIWADLDGDGIPAPGDVAKAMLIAAGAQSYPSVVCYGTNETDNTNQTGNDTNQTNDDDDDQGDNNDDQGNQTNTTMSVLLRANPGSGKANLNVTFSCSVSDGTAPFSYEWLLTSPGVSENWSTQSNETSASMNYLLGKGTWKMTCTATDAENRTANSTKSIAVAANSTGNSGGGSGHSGGGSSRGGSAVFRVYPEIAENATEAQPAANATVVKVAEKPKNATTEKQKDEKIPEVAIAAESQENTYKPSMWMIGAIIALVVASLGITGAYFSETFRKKKAFA